MTGTSVAGVGGADRITPFLGCSLLQTTAALSPSLAGAKQAMPQNITVHVHTLVEAAEREIETLSADEAVALHGRDDVVFVDLRDIRELNREGRVPGAFHCPRGMLEFWVDPESKYHKPVFGEDKRFVFFCAAGQRSALATQTAQRMGLQPVAHIAGVFGAWKAAGGPIEAPAATKPNI
jgi:rhodanese-related sulfurtransferase